MDNQNGADICAHCGAPFELLTKPQPASQRDLDIARGLPGFAPCTGDVCRRCGVPAIRSALSLQILPLVLIEPEEGSSVEQMIEAATGVQIADDRGQLIKVDEDEEVDVLRKALAEAPAAADGRGAMLPISSLRRVGPALSYVVNGPDGPRVALCVDPTSPPLMCAGCKFFFAASELEIALVTSGNCPVCGHGLVL